MAVILQEQDGRGLAGAQLLQLGLQQLPLGLQLGLAAQRHLQRLQRLLQHLLLGQQLHPVGGARWEAGERGRGSASSPRTGGGGGGGEAAWGEPTHRSRGWVFCSSFCSSRCS